MQQGGRPYLLDRASLTVYKDVSAHTVPELVGKWVHERVVFRPPTTEVELYVALAEYLQVRAGRPHGPTKPRGCARTRLHLCGRLWGPSGAQLWPT